MQRRASLSISTNAIVVLIVAVIMLGLILGFVTQGFGLVEDKILSEIRANERVPEAASLNQPVTLSSNHKIVQRGDYAALKVNAYNPAMGDRSLSLALQCANSAAPFEDVQANAQTVPGNSFREYTLTWKVPSSATPKVYLCKVDSRDGGTVVGSGEFNLEVRG